LHPSIRGSASAGASSNDASASASASASTVYDPQTVRTFFESDAINSLSSQLLYDAIFEFTIKFDVIEECYVEPATVGTR